MAILPFLGSSKGRLVSLLRAALGRASHRDIKTRRQETSRRGFALWERRGPPRTLCSAMPTENCSPLATSPRLPQSTPCHGDHLRGRPSWRKPLTELQRRGEKFLPTALPTPSSPCFQLCLLRSRSCRPSGCLQQATQPAPAGMCSAFQHFPSCLMYAGFKRIASEQNTGMDLNEPWITALELFNSRK